MKKYFSLLTAIGLGCFSISSYAALITYNVNASPNPGSVETLSVLTYDASTGVTSTVSDAAVYGSLSGSASFSLDTSDLGSMTKFYRSPDINDFFMFIDGTTPNNILSNQVSFQNTQLGAPIVFNRGSNDPGIYTSFDSTSSNFSLNLQLNGSSPVRTYGEDGSYSDFYDYFYTSFSLEGDLTRTSFEDTLLVTGFNALGGGGWLAQGHYLTTNYFDADGFILKSDTILNMQQFYFSANEVSITIDDNSSVTVTEPQGLWLMGLGLLGLGVCRQRRKHI
jgi:hypothetical protein